MTRESRPWLSARNLAIRQVQRGGHAVAGDGQHAVAQGQQGLALGGISGSHIGTSHSADGHLAFDETAGKARCYEAVGSLPAAIVRFP